jgi:glycosyltransferase involved in cell wall biosynthesis
MKYSYPQPKVFVVMPAYNAAGTLRLTYSDMPRDRVDTVILVDDNSSDETLEVARQLGLESFIHDRNYGYGANQKTCYREALKGGADIVVMLHPDYQYDTKLIPEMIKPILEQRAEVVLGSRLMGVSPISQGMPWWKYVANRALTKLENVVFGLHLSEYHTGYRAYSRRALESVNFEMNSDAFVFDQEIIAQFVQAKQRIVDVPVPTRYFKAASSISFVRSVRYGLSILWVLSRFLLHRSRLLRQRSLDSLSMRYVARQGKSAV